MEHCFVCVKSACLFLMQLNTFKPGLNHELDPSDSVCSHRLARQWLKVMCSSEAIAAGFSKTHSSSADGPFFIEYDRTIGVKVSHLICKLCLRSMLWGTHRACLDRITALELKPPANTMRQIPSHAACGQILSFTNPYLTLTVPWSKVLSSVFIHPQHDPSDLAHINMQCVCWKCGGENEPNGLWKAKMTDRVNGLYEPYLLMANSKA